MNSTHSPQDGQDGRGASASGPVHTQPGLFTPRQLGLFGGEEPTDCDAPLPPSGGDEAVSEAQPGLFDGRQLSFAEGARNHSDKGGSDPSSDPAANPKNTAFSAKKELLDRLTAEMALHPSHEGLQNAVKRLGWCGQHIANRQVPVVFKGAGAGRVGRSAANLQHCGGSMCPLCAPFKALRRRDALVAQAENVASLGGQNFHVVLTARHRRNSPVARLIDSLMASMSAARRSSRWKRDTLGFVRASEITWTEKNGHHFHLHVLLTLTPDADAEAFREWLKAFFSRKMQELTGLKNPCQWVESTPEKRGWWSRIDGKSPAALLTYLTKTVGGEINAGAFKGKSAPWSMPAMPFAEAWQALKGHRWFGTAGCWKTAETEELEDEEKANERESQDGPMLFAVDPDAWCNWGRKWRTWIVGLMSNRALPDAEFVARVVRFAASRGSSIIFPVTMSEAPPSS